MNLVFDVESLGLYGTGFAVGWVVVDQFGREWDEGYLACPAEAVENYDLSHEDAQFLTQNVLPHLPEPNCANDREVRDKFWEHWSHWKERGATLVADCAYPVETGFLRACVEDDLEGRKWEGPYPLLDLSSFLVAHGEDPTRTFERYEDELPAHHPVHDARQSARLFLELAYGIQAGAKGERDGRLERKNRIQSEGTRR